MSFISYFISTSICKPVPNPRAQFTGPYYYKEPSGYIPTSLFPALGLGENTWEVNSVQTLGFSDQALLHLNVFTLQAFICV